MCSYIVSQQRWAISATRSLMKRAPATDKPFQSSESRFKILPTSAPAASLLPAVFSSLFPLDPPRTLARDARNSFPVSLGQGSNGDT